MIRFSLLPEKNFPAVDLKFPELRKYNYTMTYPPEDPFDQCAGLFRHTPPSQARRYSWANQQGMRWTQYVHYLRKQNGRCLLCGMFPDDYAQIERKNNLLLSVYLDPDNEDAQPEMYCKSCLGWKLLLPSVDKQGLDRMKNLIRWIETKRLAD